MLAKVCDRSGFCMNILKGKACELVHKWTGFQSAHLFSDWLDFRVQPALLRLHKWVKVCENPSSSVKMLSSEQILERVAQDGYIDMYA